MILAKEIIKGNGCIKMVDGSFVTNRGIANPSIVKYKDKILMSFRSCDYTYVNYAKKISYENAHIWYPLNVKGIPAHFVTDNYICELNDALEIEKSKKFLNAETQNLVFNGYEDIRLVVWNDKLHAIASVPNESKTPIVACTLDDEFNIVSKFEYVVTNIEKNWMPICDTPSTFMYKCPSETITLNNGTFEIKNTNVEGHQFYKGSTQLVNYKGGYLAIVHTNNMEKRRDMNYYEYNHQFIYMSKDFKVIAMSKPFSFLGFPIEFTCGMHIEDGEVWLPFSAFDCISFISKFKVEVIDELLFGVKHKFVKENSTPFENIIESSNEKEIPLLISKYIVSHEMNNYAARICFNTYLGSEAKSLTAQRKAYIDALLDVKKFDIRQGNGYLHMLIQEDRIIDQINSL